VVVAITAGASGDINPICGPGNGSSGYICTDKAFTEGGYEVKVTRLMPGAEMPLTSKVLQMIDKL